MRLGSLFAGIGGFDLGFERAGFESVFVCEIDRAAQSVLRRRFPRAVLFDDVRTIGAHNLPAIDVLTFGSPCQDLSVAGKRAGLAGDRSGLFHEAIRVIQELRDRDGGPDFAVWENVPGAFSSNGGADFAAVVQAMVNLGARDVAWRVVDSRFFGVAQRRRRVFLVADFAGERAEQVLFEPESLRGDSAKSGKKREEAARGARARIAEGGREWPAQVASTLDCDFATKWGQNNQHINQGCPLFVPALLQPIAFHPTQDPISSTDGVSHAMSSGNRTGCGTVAVYHATAIRRLTPTECERLQGFPDEWTAEGIDGRGNIKQQADAPRYKQLGNAVTVSVAEWIARRLRQACGGQS